MKRHSRRLAFCSVTAALGITLMVVLGLTGIGTYGAPLMASLLLVPVRQRYGKGTALTVWLATGLMGMLVVPDGELALMYLAVFGWYPILRPWLTGFPAGVSLVLRYVVLNVAFLLTSTVGLTVLGLEGAIWPITPLNAAFILLMNVVFTLEDAKLLPRVEEVSRSLKW